MMGSLIDDPEALSHQKRSYKYTLQVVMLHLLKAADIPEDKLN
jgi:hypothetical protein